MEPIGAVDEIRRTGENSTPDATGMSELGRDDFLKLMIAQLENQDPFEPMADQEFIAQMAEFSALEEMQAMNKNLSSSLDWSLHLSRTINNTMATSLIGRTVRADHESVHLGESGDASLRFELAATSSDVTIEITDRDGNLVSVLRRQDVQAGEQTWNWDGRDLQGNRLSDGLYQFTIKAEDVNGDPIAAVGFFEGTVGGVQYVDGAAYLDVDGVLVPLDSVQAILRTDDGGGA